MGHNITRLKIPAGSLEANQLAIVQAWLRIWTRDYREQIQQASPGLEPLRHAASALLKC